MSKVRLMRSIGLCSALLLALVGPVLQALPAADQFSGRWQAAMAGEGQAFSFIFEFKANGEVLTGTVGIASQDRTFEIKEGKIKGNTVSFVGFGIWNGTLNGDELSLTRELDDGKKQTMKAHRKNAE